MISSIMLSAEGYLQSLGKLGTVNARILLRVISTAPGAVEEALGAG